MRCEWVKSKARADRWNEEVLLIKEEMQRVLVYFEWKTGEPKREAGTLM